MRDENSFKIYVYKVYQKSNVYCEYVHINLFSTLCIVNMYT